MAPHVPAWYDGFRAALGSSRDLIGNERPVLRALRLTRQPASSGFGGLIDVRTAGVNNAAVITSPIPSVCLMAPISRVSDRRMMTVDTLLTAYPRTAGSRSRGKIVIRLVPAGAGADSSAP